MGRAPRRGVRWLVAFGAASFALALAPGALSPTPAAAGDWDGITMWETATVDRIVDGDTMMVIDDATGEKRRIRFIGINAPEKEVADRIVGAGHAGQCGWKQAYDELSALAPAGSKVRLASSNQSSKGLKSRPQRVVFALNPLTNEYDIDLSWAMAERGWGIWFTVAHEAAMSAKYRAVVDRARERGVGIWDPTLCGEREQPDAMIDMRIGLASVSGTVDDEWVSLRNTGTTTVDLSGWWLRNSDNTGWFTLPGGTVLTPGDYRVVHSGKGTSGKPDGHDVYAGARRKIYQDPVKGGGQLLVGDGAYLLDKAGAYRFWREYPCAGDCAQDPLPDIAIDRVFLGRNRGKARAATQTVTIANWGPVTTCMDGARIESGSSVYRFKPGVCIAPGGTWTLVGGTGTDTPTTGHWNKTVPALWLTGSAILRNDLGTIASTKSW